MVPLKLCTITMYTTYVLLNIIEIPVQKFLTIIANWTHGNFV